MSKRIGLGIMVMGLSAFSYSFYKLHSIRSPKFEIGQCITSNYKLEAWEKPNTTQWKIVGIGDDAYRTDVIYDHSDKPTKNETKYFALTNDNYIVVECSKLFDR